MKNIFKTNVNLPSNTKITKINQLFCLKNLQGRIFLDLFPVSKNSGSLVCKKGNYNSTFFRLLQKAIIGVNLAFVIRLFFVGVGFRVESVENNVIKLKLGFSHFVFIKIPSFIKIFVPKKTRLIIKSCNHQILKEFSAKICSFKFPDVYKGKGILIKNQKLILKEGKKK
jgi:large subunit ribosomal protein L6